MKRCFYYDEIEIKGPVRVGVDWLFKEAKKKDGGWLALNVLENLQTIYEQYPGLNELRELENKFSSIINGVEIHLILKDSLPSDGRDFPLLAVHPSKDFLENIDDLRNVSSMMVIPWSPNEVEQWIINNRALVYLTEISYEYFDENYFQQFFECLFLN